MKALINIIILTLAISSAAYGQTWSYKPGEKISYVIKYGLLTGGVASLEIKCDTLKGKEVLHSKFVARTTGLADALYKVLDIYESFIDPETELPVKSIRNVREGRYKNYNEVLFDHNTRSDSTILESDLTGIHIAPKGIHDIISCFYFFRNHILPSEQTLKKGDIITIMTWFTDELYPIRMKYIGMDDVRTGEGKIRCYRFNPVTEVGRLFKSEEDVSFWFSADKNFLPVKIRFNIFVGAFVVELEHCEGLVAPLEIKKR